MSIGPGRSTTSRACAVDGADGVASNTGSTGAAPSPSLEPRRKFGSAHWCWSSGSTVQAIVLAAASQPVPARRAESRHAALQRNHCGSPKQANIMGCGSVTSARSFGVAKSALAAVWKGADLRYPSHGVAAKTTSVALAILTPVRTSALTQRGASVPATKPGTEK